MRSTTLLALLLAFASSSVQAQQLDAIIARLSPSDPSKRPVWLPATANHASVQAKAGGKAMDYDDPAIEEAWCDEQRANVTAYLAREGVTHGRVGEWPAWHVAPYVSVWAIESAVTPDAVGWWVISGDLPTDYVSARDIHHPREAVRAIAERWHDASSKMAQGQTPTDFQIGDPSQAAELAPLLQSRARLLSQWVDEEEIWPDP